MSLRNMCEPKLFFQSTPFDEVPKSGLMVFFFLAVTSFLDIYILSDPISIFSYCKTIAPIGLMVLMPINYWRYDIGRLFEFRRQIDPRLEEGKLNLRIYFVEAIVILLCGLTFTIIFDCIVFLQRALIG